MLCMIRKEIMKKIVSLAAALCLLATLAGCSLASRLSSHELYTQLCSLTISPESLRADNKKWANEKLDFAATIITRPFEMEGEDFKDRYYVKACLANAGANEFYLDVTDVMDNLGDYDVVMINGTIKGTISGTVGDNARAFLAVKAKSVTSIDIRYENAPTGDIVDTGEYTIQLLNHEALEGPSGKELVIYYNYINKTGDAMVSPFVNYVDGYQNGFFVYESKESTEGLNPDARDASESLDAGGEGSYYVKYALNNETAPVTIYFIDNEFQPIHSMEFAVE